MRYIGLLLTLLLIGLLVYRQLSRPPAPSPIDTGGTAGAIKPPSVPQRPQDVPKFKKDFNNYLKNVDAEQKKKLEKETQ